MNSKLNEKIMRRCFTLAKRGKGAVSPNPLVGSVIVKNGRIISEGWHKIFGGAHAERNAINDAKTNLSGASIYCNLEPCCHMNKKTPPCVPLIIKSGIKKVYISTIDPNPDVAGKGIKQLKDSGIEVVQGILQDEGNELNKFFFKYVHNKSPYVTVKIAQSTDGKISKAKGKQYWLTGKESLKYVHTQRAVYDAVLVGANTINTDNPQLTVRHTKGRNPVRVLIDGRLSSSLNSNIFNCSDIENTWVLTSTSSNSKKKKSLKEKGVRIFEFKTDNNKLNLKSVLKRLGKKNIASIFVEGGQKIFSQFIEQKLYDEIILLQAPVILGSGVDSLKLLKEQKLKIISAQKLGSDLKIRFTN